MILRSKGNGQGGRNSLEPGCERQARDRVSTRGNSGAEQGSWWDYRREAGRKNREGLKGRHRRRAQKEGDSFGVSLLGPGEYPRPSSHSSQAGDFLFTPHLRAHAKSHQLLAVPHLVYSILTHTARSGQKTVREQLMERVGTQADGSEWPCLLCWANGPVPALSTHALCSE